MPKFIAVFNTAKPLTPENYTSLYRLLESMPQGIRLKSSVMLLRHEGDHNDLCALLCEHLTDEDELTIFQLASGTWRVDREKDGLRRQQQLQDFLKS